MGVERAAGIRMLTLTLCALWSGGAVAASLHATVALAEMQGSGEEHGAISLSDHHGGARIRATLDGLPSGPYAVEVHEGTSCGISYESHPGPEGTSPLMPRPAGAAGPEIADAGVITVSPKGTARQTFDVHLLSNVDRFERHAIVLRGERLLCGVLD